MNEKLCFTTTTQKGQISESKDARGYLPDLTNFLLGLVLVGVLLGVGIAYAVPAIWSFMKPYIHEITK